MAPERATTGACVASCSFCLFRLYAAALTLRLFPARFQADAAEAGVVVHDRAVCQSSAAAAGMDIKFL